MKLNLAMSFENDKVTENEMEEDVRERVRERKRENEMEGCFICV